MMPTDAKLRWTDRWTSLRILGRGRTSVVHLVCGREGPAAKRRFALKVMRDEGGLEHRWRFAQEAELLPRLAQPGVPAFVEAELTAEEPFIVTEYVDGLRCDKLLTDETQPDAASATRFFDRMLATLEDCHAKGHSHGDLKPHNMILRGGRLDDPVLLDFGATTHLGSAAGEDAGAASLASPSRKDLTNAALVFLFVLSRLRMTEVDIFLWDRPPHQHKAISERLVRYGPGLTSIFDRAFSPLPQRRFSSAAQMRAAFGAIRLQEGGPIIRPAAPARARPEPRPVGRGLPREAHGSGGRT